MNELGQRRRVLFLCTGNSCRSQMAEGFARARLGDRVEVFSAGIEKHGMNPHAMRVMEEAGVGIGGHSSKTLADLGGQEFDFVVTVCGHAHESCPLFQGEAVVVHRGFEDPPKLAAGLSQEEEILDCYRRVRDEIDAYVQTLPAELLGESWRVIGSG